MKPEFKGAFPECSWCYGRGCNQCPSERKEYEANLLDQLENPQPIFSAKTDNPHDMQLMKTYFGKEALERAFGPEGGGQQEIERNGCVASLIQLLHSEHPEPEEEVVK